MVKTERLEFVIELLTSVMNHWVFFPLVMTAVGVSMRLLGSPRKVTLISCCGQSAA